MPPIEFVLFACTLLGVALFHHQTLRVALIGLAAITAYKFFFSDFSGTAGLAGLQIHLMHEWVTLANLLGLLLGFTLLARHFEQTRLPLLLPALLPDDWRGGLTLLAMVFVMSAFLDNIAAAMIGGSIASSVFRKRVHIGYLAALVAAANAGGAGSVIGDTTTTMMWLDGVRARDVLHAYIAAGAAFAVFAVPASLQQQRYSPITKDPPAGVRLDSARLVIVSLILLAAILANLAQNLWFRGIGDHFPVLGAAVWLMLLATAAWRAPQWALLPEAMRSTLFLLSLVLCASMMPVERLPAASWPTALGLGALSSVFDNIPLTKLALDAGGYDWGFLAYAVGFGGSMVWFGSSAGVALAGRYPDARSVGAWLRGGWHVALGYLAGFLVLLLTLGWHPHAPHT